MIYPDDVPVLTDGVATLRPHRDSDIDAMVEMCNDSEFVRWTSVPTPYGDAQARGFIEDVVRPGWEHHQHRGWAIEYVDDDGRARFGGNIDVRGMPVADVGFGLHPDARGRGLMTRAIRLAVAWSFENDVEVVHWRSHVGNVASLRTAWSSGFSLHGTTPGFLHERGKVLDAWTGSIRPGDDGSPRTKWWATPVLTGDGVRLRPMAKRDIPRIVEGCSDPSTTHWVPTMTDRHTEEGARAFLASDVYRAAVGAVVSWCIADPDTDTLLGNISVLRINERTATGEIGYWAHPDARGRGVVAEAARLVVR
ncbi:MAG: GNAT family N-acetyltransferase, partial [Nocardioidaceae bacterium]